MLHPGSADQPSTLPATQAIVFVSSRRQTRATAMDIISHAVADDKPRAFLHMTEAEVEDTLYSVRVGGELWRGRQRARAC